MMLVEGERIDRIAGTRDSIIQSQDVFSYSIDAVLLGRFASIPIKAGRILDLCSGNGIVGLVVARRTKATIQLVELQEQLHSMAERSIKLNDLTNQIVSHQLDVKNLRNAFSHGEFDTVTCNPPYFPVHSNKLIKEKVAIALARHELACTLNDVISSASFVLKHGGKLAMVHRPERLAEMVLVMQQNGIEPKRIRLCHAREDESATILLVEGIKGGKPGLRIEAPLFIYQADGEYTQRFQQEYFNQ